MAAELTFKPKMRMPSRSRSSFSRTMVATAPLVGVRNANTSSRLKAAAAAMAAGSNLTEGHGKGFTETSSCTGSAPGPMALARIVLHRHSMLCLNAQVLQECCARRHSDILDTHVRHSHKALVRASPDHNRLCCCDLEVELGLTAIVMQ